MTTATNDEALRGLIHKLDAAVRLGDVPLTTETVKRELQAFCRRGGVLPERYCSCRPEGYARRLLHRDLGLRYTMVAMTWGPGQGTELHDHAGIWCVECVLAGELEVTQYDVVARERDRFRFERRQRVQAGVGTAGCLIPPFEYHVLANALTDRPTLTLHVYGGEMDFCNLYRPGDSGWWIRVPKQLDYAN